MKDLHPRVVALAVTLVPGRAASLLGRHLGIDPGDAGLQISAGRADRLRAAGGGASVGLGRRARTAEGQGPAKHTARSARGRAVPPGDVGAGDPPPAWRVLVR